MAAEALERLKDDAFFYVLGDGAVWGLAYQYGYTNLMEYAKIHAACLRSSEWRHGPLEVLPSSPAMVQFVGTDSSREYSLATQAYCRSRGARLAVFDSRDYFDTHPVLAPFALHTVSQLFLIYVLHPARPGHGRLRRDAHQAVPRRARRTSERKAPRGARYSPRICIDPGALLGAVQLDEVDGLANAPDQAGRSRSGRTPRSPAAHRAGARAR